MITEHTVGRTGTDPIIIEKESEPTTKSYARLVMDDLMDAVLREAKSRRLAVIAYDIHQNPEFDTPNCGTYLMKVVAFCHPYVLPTFPS